MTTPDRLTVSIGRKISITRFENLDIYIGYSMDKPVNVDPKTAIRKLEEFVIEEFDRLVQIVQDGKVKGARS